MTTPLQRSDRVDALRGAAMLWMAGFHFGFDLNHLGMLSPRQNFYSDPFWTGQRTAIVSLFLFCAGLALALALANGQGWPRFWRRWGQIVGCALLVSIGSAWMFPRSWIFFGVLHGIAVMLLLARMLAPRASIGALCLLGALAIAAPRLVQGAVFDSRWTAWVGLVTRKPVTEDFVPVLPWLGVVLWGLAAGQWLLAHRAGWLAGRLPRLVAAGHAGPLEPDLLHAAPVAADRRAHGLAGVGGGAAAAGLSACRRRW